MVHPPKLMLPIFFHTTILLFSVRCVDAKISSAFIIASSSSSSSLSLSSQRGGDKVKSLFQTFSSTSDNNKRDDAQRNNNNNDNDDDYVSSSSLCCTVHTNRLTTASGKPVSRYALGGAARSVQPQSLPLKYRDVLILQQQQQQQQESGEEQAAPFYFYYNPHRYPAFLSGVVQSFSSNDDDDDDRNLRKDTFLASGGTDRSPSSIDERLKDALVHSGGNYLDAFVLEYICPYELTPTTSDESQPPTLGKELRNAIDHAHRLKEEGKIRYVMASTHSHVVGAALASAKLLPSSHPETPAFDALMLRYSMSHRNAAESLSFPKAMENNIPVLAFTTTRWNRLQSDPPPSTMMMDGFRPTTSECLKFALHHPAVEVVLHSARDEEELDEALLPLLSSSLATSERTGWLSEEECEQWRVYGSDEARWNEDDAFDEYPEESI